MTEKGDIFDSAYKEGTSLKNLHMGTSTSSRARETQERDLEQRQKPGGGDEDRSLPKVPKERDLSNSDIAEFERMEILLEENISGTTLLFDRLSEESGQTIHDRPEKRRLDGAVRAIIKAEVTKAGYTLAHFNHAIRWDMFKNRGIRNPPAKPGRCSRFEQTHQSTGTNTPMTRPNLSRMVIAVVGWHDPSFAIARPIRAVVAAGASFNWRIRAAIFGCIAN